MPADVYAHEAAHSLVAWSFGIPIKTVSVYSAEGHSGRLRPDKGAIDSSELDFATVLVAGSLGEKRALTDKLAKLYEKNLDFNELTFARAYEYGIVFNEAYEIARSKLEQKAR